jgi:hypothetical protein
MKILREGHRYELANFENKEAKGQEIQFIEKEVCTLKNESDTTFSNTQLVTVNDGTTNEEVIEVLIDRLQYLNGKFPCRENALAITKLEESLMWLNKRTADRVKRNVEGTNQK